MASPGSDTPRTSPAAPIRKPLAILHISKKEEEDRRLKEAAEQAAVEAKAQAAASKVQPKPSFEGRSTSNDMEGLTMADLLGAAEKKREPQAGTSSRRQGALSGDCRCRFPITQYPETEASCQPHKPSLPSR